MDSERASGPPSYVPIIAAYGSAVGTAALAIRLSRRRIAVPDLRDVLLLGVGTFKLSRLIAKDKVMQPVREPFVRSTEPGDGAEVNSEPGGAGTRRALGELLTCPFCVSVWVATALSVAFAVAPRATRLVAGGLGAMALADVGQYGFSSFRAVAERTEEG